MNSSSSAASNNKIAIILTSGFADWEYALLAGTGKAFYGLNIEFFSPRVGEIISQGGLATLVSRTIDEILPWSPKVIVVVGGTIWETDDAPHLTELLNAHYTSGGMIAGICGGTLALARSGLLNHVAHTSNNIDFLTNNVATYDGTQYYQQTNSAVSDNRIITAVGTAPVSFTAAIFEGVGLSEEAVMQFTTMMAAEHE